MGHAKSNKHKNYRQRLQGLKSRRTCTICGEPINIKNKTGLCEICQERTERGMKILRGEEP